MQKIKINNNLELLRLAFALQVMIVHLSPEASDSYTVLLGHFPGVPAFFFISGFLIYASYVNSNSLVSYVANRFLRIYPGLFFVTIGSVFLICFSKGQSFINNNLDTIAEWVVLQLTLGQGYNPPEFSDIGVGAINGVLWTITVEIIFYISVPIIRYLEKYSSAILPILFITSFSIYAVGKSYLSQPFMLGKSLFEFVNLTPVVWGWMFILGIYTYKNIEQILKISNKFYLVIPAIVLLAVVDDKGVFLGSSGNRLGLFYMVLYCALIIYVAFELRPIKINFDISYGIYIWHMVVLNAALTINHYNPVMIAILTIAIALVSWYAVEKPCLRLKATSLLHPRGKNSGQLPSMQHPSRPNGRF